MILNKEIESNQQDAEICLRKPLAGDGTAVHRLVSQCPPLDGNSVYCNLLQCTHFADTGCVAEVAGEVRGFISGYILPDRPDTLFIWQVAISETMRRRGLAGKMLREILARPFCRNLQYLQSTVTGDNRASAALFLGLADSLRSHCKRNRHFTREQHFGGQHDTEYLLTIGPFGLHADRADNVHPFVKQQMTEVFS